MDFDLNILALNQRSGMEIPHLTGVRGALPPRRAARGRDNDRLVIYIVPNEHATPDLVNKLLDGIEKTYFSTPGTVTTAIRVVMEEVNSALLSYNAKRANQTVMVCVSLIVMRGDLLYLAQSGLTHGFIFNPQKFKYIHEPQVAGQGLGISKTVNISYAQNSLSNGLLAMVTPKVPATWKETTLQGLYGQHMHTIESRLLADAENNLVALIIGVQQGKGKINIALSSAQAQAPQASQPMGETEPRDLPPVDIAAEPSPSSFGGEDAGLVQPTPSASAATPPSVSTSQMAYAPPIAPDEKDESKPRTASKPTVALPPEIGDKLNQWGHKFREILQHALGSLRRFLLHSLPMEGELSLSSTAMASIAIAVPVVVVAITILFYLQVGLPKQQKTLLERAEAYLAEAQNLMDAHERYDAWSEALKYINLAEQYKETDESAELREQIKAKLDVFDRVTRLDFQPAIEGGVGANVEIIQLEATARELFILNKKSGNVLHARLAGEAYELTDDFRCGPGEYGSVIMGEIIDMVALPRTTQESTTLVAMDDNGTVLYCEPNSTPTVATLTPPKNNWGDPSLIAVQETSLFVLDKLTNDIWIYYMDNGEYRNAPSSFFSDEAPDLENAIDFDIGQNQGVLLHNDGHVTLCDHSIIAVSPTTCTDPATLQDDRPGRESGPTIDEARFYQVVSTQPPEPSVYFLDPISRSLYQFSVKLNIIQQFKSADELPAGLATAFAVSPTRSVVMAIGNQVYTATLP